MRIHAAFACATLALTLIACPTKKREQGESENQDSSSEPTGASEIRDAGPGATGESAALEPVTLPPAPPVPEPPLGLPGSPLDTEDPRLAARVALGRLLFFDARLSTDERISCASCHDPKAGWADGRERARTVAGKLNLRHTPTLVGLAYADAFAWDGRFDDLATMLASHWRGQMQAGNTAERALAAVRESRVYRAHFARAFKAPARVDEARMSASLAAFVRTLYSGASPWDRHEAGEPGAVTEDAIAGFEIFNRQAQCALCHSPPLYTDGAYHDVGIGALGPDGRLLDPGRELATKNPLDRGRFKTPTLRHIAATAPYFHDGSASDLAATIEHGLRGAARLAGTDAVPARLTDDETAKLLAFLRALTPTAALED